MRVVYRKRKGKNMSDTTNVTPENCTHNCMTCGSSCNDNEHPGKFFEAVDNFSKTDATELLDALNELGKED